MTTSSANETNQLLQRQCLLLEALLNNSRIPAHQQQQQAQQLATWKQQHPQLASKCAEACQHLGDIQSQFISEMVEDLLEQREELKDGNFMLWEFLDKYGQRMAHLNMIISMISNMGS